MNFLVEMFGKREPFKSELEFFKKRPEVSGMATEDNKIILNPFSKNTPEEQEKVAQNEALRLFMKVKKIVPEFDLNDKQKKLFKGTEYAKDQESAKQSIIARILTGDPSANATTEQIKEAEKLFEYVMKFAPKEEE